ncbi:hypothetical protein TNCV_1775621 [Trichonephila clavipes]|nr:hypothetical protein TNCV_1775621 [Trichonephila clavipes]
MAAFISWHFSDQQRLLIGRNRSTDKSDYLIRESTNKHSQLRPTNFKFGQHVSFVDQKSARTDFEKIDTRGLRSRKR